MSAISLSRPFASDVAAASNVTVTVARTLEQVEALRPAWTNLPNTDIDSDIDYFMTVVRHAKQVVGPHVVHIRRDDGADLMAIARLENLPVAFRFGYHAFGSVTLRAIVVTFGGILGAKSPQDEALVLRHLMSALDSGEAGLLLMRNVDAESTLHAASVAAVGWARRTHAQPSSPRWIASIPDSLERFLDTRSSKTRQTLRRHDRQLATHYGDRLRLRRWDRPEDIGDICRHIESVAAKTYQRGLGVGFLNDPMQIALIDLGLKRGWHRTWMLFLDERPISFWTGFGYAGTFAIGTPGFDPEYTADSVGRFTMMRMIEDLCADPEIRQLDFGHGDAEYKSAFGRRAMMETDVLLAARRPWPMMVLFAVSALSFANSQARRFVENSQWGRRLKTAWRRRLARGG